MNEEIAFQTGERTLPRAPKSSANWLQNYSYSCRQIRQEWGVGGGNGCIELENCPQGAPTLVNTGSILAGLALTLPPYTPVCGLSMGRGRLLLLVIVAL